MKNLQNNSNSFQSYNYNFAINQFNNKSLENNNNPWELFFNQPFDYKLKYVKKIC